MIFRRLVSFIAIVIAAQIASADSQTERVRQVAQQDSAALTSGDYAHLVDLTYPKLVELLGGRDKMIETLRTGTEDMKAHGSAILGAQVSEPKEIVIAGDKQFAIVPMVVRVHVPEGTLRSSSFLVAVSEDHGKTWKFIDGAGLHKGAVTEKETLAQIVPGFPTQLSLPPWEPPVLEPK